VTLISFLYSFITFIRFYFLIVFSMSMFVCLSAVVAAVFMWNIVPFAFFSIWQGKCLILQGKVATFIS